MIATEDLTQMRAYGHDLLEHVLRVRFLSVETCKLRIEPLGLCLNRPIDDALQIHN